MPADCGMDQTAPAPAGAGILPAVECAVTGPLQLLRGARELPGAETLFRLGHGMHVEVAQSAWGQAAEFDLGAVPPGPRPGKDSTPWHYRSQASQSVCLRAALCSTEASTTEEPDAGKLHVRVCTGGAG